MRRFHTGTWSLRQWPWSSGALPGMRERGFGRVLSVSSTALREPIPILMLWNAHSPGLLATFWTLARQVASDGVIQNTILRGWIATDRMFDTASSRTARRSPEKREIRIRRLGLVEELAAVAAFLCSERASYLPARRSAWTAALPRTSNGRSLRRSGTWSSSSRGTRKRSRGRKAPSIADDCSR